MNVTIIGSGNMGRGIGTRAAAGGHSVTFVDANPEVAEKAATDVKAFAKKREGFCCQPRRGRAW
jgi:3-hydroxyacyl-CoA dehydrogenase